MTSSPSSTKSVLGDLLEPSGDLGEVALERLLVLRLQVDAAAAPMCEAAEAIVLRLVLPAWSRWAVRRQLRPPSAADRATAGSKQRSSTHRRRLATSPRNPPSRPGAQCAASHPATAAAAPSPPTTARRATSPTRPARSGSPASPSDGPPRPRRSAPRSGTRRGRRVTGPSLTFRTEVQVAQMPAKKASGRLSSKANQTGGRCRRAASSFSAKLVKGTRQRCSGPSQARQCDEVVCRMLVTPRSTFLPARYCGGVGMPQRAMTSSRPSGPLRMIGAL